MQNNQISQNDKCIKPGENEENVRSQSISSQSTPGQQTALCDLSTRQKNEFLSKDISIRRLIKSSNAKKTESENEPDPNNNNDKDNSESKTDSNNDVQSIEHQGVYRSFSMEPTQNANLPEKLMANLQQQSSASQAQSNSLPIIQLSSEIDLEGASYANQLQAELKYRKASDTSQNANQKRTRLSKKLATHLLNKEKQQKGSTIKRTHSFNSPKNDLQKHRPKNNQTNSENRKSSRSNSIDSNLHIQASCTQQIVQQQLNKQFERNFEKRARKESSSRCKHSRQHRNHRKSSAKQLIYPDKTASPSLFAQTADTLTHNYSRSTEDIRACNCSHCSEQLAQAYYLNNGGALMYNSCFRSSTTLIADKSTSLTSGLKLHHSPIDVTNAPIMQAPFLLLPDGSVCKAHNLSLSPSPTYLSSYSAVPSHSYTTTPVHSKHKHRSRSKSIRSSKKVYVSPMPPSKIEHLTLDAIENQLNQSSSVRLSRVDSAKSKCSDERLCRKCKRKTSLNSTLRGQQNYAEFADNAKQFRHLATNYPPNQHFTTPSTSLGALAQPIHFSLPPDQLANATANPILLHTPLHLHPASAVIQCTTHEPISNTTSPTTLGHYVSPVHLYEFNNATTLLTNKGTTPQTAVNSINLTNPLLSHLNATPSALSVPDLTSFAVNLSKVTQPINLQFTHLHPIHSDIQSSTKIVDAQVSAAFAKLYRNKAAPEYFSNLFSSESEKDSLNKPKVIDYLLTGAGDLNKFLSKSSQFVNESSNSVKNSKAGLNRKSSSTESINIKTSATAPTNSNITSSSTSTIVNDKQPIKRNFFKDKLNQTKITESDKEEKLVVDKQVDKSVEDKSLNPKFVDLETKENDQPPHKQLLEKRKTNNRNPMLILLRKAQRSTEAEAPPVFELTKSLEQDDSNLEKYKSENLVECKIATNRQDEVKVEIESENKARSDNNELIIQNSIEKSDVTCDSSMRNHIGREQLEPKSVKIIRSQSKSRRFLMRMFQTSNKKTPFKQIPTISKSLENPNIPKSKKIDEIEYHTLDIPQTQEEIAESTDELRALRTHLSKGDSVTINGSKSAVSRASLSIKTNISRRSSLSKDESTESTMSKLRKKAASGFAVRFAKLTHYSSVDNAKDSAETADQTSTKSHSATISGRFSNLTSRSISLDKPSSSNVGMSNVTTSSMVDGKRSLSNLKQSTQNTSISTIGPGRHRYSVTTENMPKLTDLRKILHPEEERRDLETVCKSFWDSFIDCQCVECTFNNAAKFITAIILFLTIALVVNTSMNSSESDIETMKLKNTNIFLRTLNSTKFNNINKAKNLHDPNLKFFRRPIDSIETYQSSKHDNRLKKKNDLSDLSTQRPKLIKSILSPKKLPVFLRKNNSSLNTISTISLR